MPQILCVVFASCLFLFEQTLFAQEKKVDSAPSDIGTTIVKGFAEARLVLQEGELRLTKFKLEMAKESHQTIRELLATWKKVAEEDWARFDKQEKAEFSLYLEHTLQFAHLLQPGEAQKEVLPVAVAAFRGKKIADPTALQKKILVLPSKEKDEAKRIALTIRECLRYTAEDMVPFNKMISDINHELRLIKEAREKLSPKTQKKKK